MKKPLSIAALLWMLAIGCTKATPPAPGSEATPAPMAGSAMPATSTGATGHTRAVAAFSKLAVSGSFVINVTMGKDGPLSLHCSDEVLPKVRTDVANGTLDVHFEDGTVVRNEGPCTIDIPASTLKAITFSGSTTGKVEGAVDGLSNVNISGSGELAADQVKTDALAITLTGSGKLRLAGKVSSVSIHCSGSGQVNTAGLTADEARVDLSGSGEVQVNASRKIDTQVSGSGRVHVSGSPKERQDHSTNRGAVVFD